MAFNNNNNGSNGFKRRPRSRSAFRGRNNASTQSQIPTVSATQIQKTLNAIVQEHQRNVENQNPIVALPWHEPTVQIFSEIYEIPSTSVCPRLDRPAINPLAVAARELKFACQLAHGSPVAIIDKWSNMNELYQSIADCFGIQSSDIIFLTVNDFKADMRNLFTGTLNFKDMLYAHVRGQAVELTVTKDEKSFGVTITDNGLGNAFIKAIKPDSIFDRAAAVTSVGQLIEKVNGMNVLGKRHYEVARMLRGMKNGESLTIRLITPLQSTGPSKQQAPKRGGGMNMMKGSGTIRFKSEGGFAVENIQDQIIQAEMVGKLNEVFDTYLGVQDDQLAMRLWEAAEPCETLWQLSEAIKTSELSAFDFPDGLVFDMWGIIGDLKREQKASREAREVQGFERSKSKIGQSDFQRVFF